MKKIGLLLLFLLAAAAYSPEGPSETEIAYALESCEPESEGLTILHLHE